MLEATVPRGRKIVGFVADENVHTCASEVVKGLIVVEVAGGILRQ
jgi:hypothetical protein